MRRNTAIEILQRGSREEWETFRGREHTHLDLSGTRFHNVRWEGWTFANVSFRRCVFLDMAWWDCKIVDSNFSNTTWWRVTGNRTTWERCSFQGANILSWNHDDCVLNVCDMKGLYARGIGFDGFTLTLCDFTDAFLQDAEFTYSRIGVGNTWPATDDVWFEPELGYNVHCTPYEVHVGCCRLSIDRWMTFDNEERFYRGIQASVGYFQFYLNHRERIAARCCELECYPEEVSHGCSE